MKDEKIRYFSMFTGVGGFELGIGERGECVGFSEIDKYSNQLLANKFPNITNFGDATKINPRELPDFDMLCGGFPCQAFSIAGKRKGFNDTRGTLFFEVARIIEVKRPKIVFLENVKGLLNHDKGKTFSIIIQTISELGYDVQWMVLNSKFFGVPQNRERVFIIGSIRGEPRPEILPFRENFSKDFKQLEKKPMIIGTTKSDTARGTNSRSWVHDINGIIGAVNSTEYKQPKQIAVSCAYRTRTYRNQGGTIEMRKDNIANQLTSVTKDSMVLGYSRDEKGNTINRHTKNIFGTIKSCQRLNQQDLIIHSLYPRTGNPDVGGTGHLSKQDDTTYCLDSGNCQALEFKGMKIRRLTPIECERLQGFPDNWTEGFSDTQRYKMMGNAVTVNVIKEIGRQIFRK